MRRGRILLALALLVSITVVIAPSIGALIGGVGSGQEQYDCGSSCHVTPSSAVVTISASNLIVEKGGSVTVSVSVSGGNSGPILGVMLITKLDPVPASIPSAAGWTITADPSGSGTDNYYEITTYAGQVSLQWSLTAPQTEGVYSLFARVHHGGGGEPQFANTAVGLSFTVGAAVISEPPVVDIVSPLNWASVEGVVTVNASVESSTTIAYVLLQIDGIVVDNKSQMPFQWDVNTTEYSNGEHSLNVTAYDTNGMSGYEEISFIVNNPVTKKATANWIWMAAGGAAIILGLAGVMFFIRKKRKGTGVVEPRLDQTERELLAPLLNTKYPGYLVLVLSALGIALFLMVWYFQMTNGLVVTGMRDYGTPLMGSPWGIYIVNFIWFVGIAHGGIVMSAAIRVMKLEKYKPIARMAELLTVVTLLMAGLSIVMDMGRPSRLFEMILYYRERVSTSPLVWDLTVIMIYVTLSISYLYLLMREDLAFLRDKLPKFRWLYSLLLFGYKENEKDKIDQIAWWIALTLLVIVFLLSGGVIPWLFGLIAAQAGWFGAIQGPMYLAAALSSALAAVILMVAVMRRSFRWEKYIEADIFRGMGTALSVLVIIYLWFTLHEQLTYQYAAPTSEHDISESLLFGQYAPIFWTVVAMLLGSFSYLAASAISRKFSPMGTVVASAFVLFAFWLKRFLIVVPSLTHPRLGLYPSGVYFPTWVEYSLVIGTIAIALFLIFIFIKLFPIMEVKDARRPETKSDGMKETHSIPSEVE